MEVIPRYDESLMQDVPLADRIVNLIAERDFVTFAELSRLDGFSADRKSASLQIEDNVILWSGMSDEGADAIHALLCDGRIALADATPMTYMIDGMSLKLPLATKMHGYKRPHWLPVSFRTAEKANDKAPNGWLLYDQEKARKPRRAKRSAAPSSARKAPARNRARLG